MPAAGTRVSLRQVSKRFGDGPTVLEGVDLEAQPGEFIALLGPSGCGKSTLLRMIAGLTPCTDGSIDTETGTETAFVFQDPTLLPWRSVAGNIELPLQLRGAGEGERSTVRTAALEMVGLTGRESAYPRQLSGGQRMRVSLARALTLSPRLLLLDEPFGSLDEMTRERLNEELLAIHRRQRWTAFFVTHSVTEAVFLSHRVLILGSQPGRLVADVRIDLDESRTAETRLEPRYQAAVAAVFRKIKAR